MKMKKQDNKEAYVEVLEILKHMDKKYVDKIPAELIDFFNKNASKEYEFSLDKTIPFEEQVLKDDTINILAMINYNYWCEDEEHKKYLLNKYNENELKYQEELKKKYNTDNLFKRSNRTNYVYKKEEFNELPQEYEEPEWYVLLFEEIYERVTRFIRRLLS